MFYIMIPWKASSPHWLLKTGQEARRESSAVGSFPPAARFSAQRGRPVTQRETCPSEEETMCFPTSCQAPHRPQTACPSPRPSVCERDNPGLHPSACQGEAFFSTHGCVTWISLTSPPSLSTPGRDPNPGTGCWCGMGGKTL